MEFGVNSADGFMREKEWRKEIHLTAFAFTYNRCWIIIALDLIGIFARDSFDLEGYLSATRKF